MKVQFNNTVKIFGDGGIKLGELNEMRSRPSTQSEIDFNNLLLYKFLRLVTLNPSDWFYLDIGTYEGLEKFLKCEEEVTREYIYNKILEIQEVWGNRGTYVLDYKKSIRIPHNYKVEGKKKIKSLLNIWLMRVVLDKFNGKSLKSYGYVANIIQRNYRGYKVRKEKLI